MASTQNDTCAMGGTVVTLGVLGASVFPTQIKTPSISGGMFYINSLGASATVQILPIQMSGLNIAGATGVGGSMVGYPVGSSQVISWLGPASFYLACTGATSTCAFLFEYAANSFGSTLG